MDPESAKEVRELIMKLKEEGGTIFLSNHNLEEAELLCNRIAVFRTRLMVVDTPQNLRNHLFQRKVIVELEEVNEKIINAVNSLDFSKDGRQLIIELRDFDKNRPELVRSIVESNGKIRSMFEKKHSLEEIYLILIKEEEDMKHEIK